MAVCMLLSAPVHSMVTCGCFPSLPATRWATSCAESSLVTNSGKSAPTSWAIFKRSEDRSRKESKFNESQ